MIIWFRTIKKNHTYFSYLIFLLNDDRSCFTFENLAFIIIFNCFLISLIVSLLFKVLVIKNVRSKSALKLMAYCLNVYLTLFSDFKILIDLRSSYKCIQYDLPAFSVGKQFEAHHIFVLSSEGCPSLVSVFFLGV